MFVIAPPQYISFYFILRESVLNAIVNLSLFHLLTFFKCIFLGVFMLLGVLTAYFIIIIIFQYFNISHITSEYFFDSQNYFQKWFKNIDSYREKTGESFYSIEEGDREFGGWWGGGGGDIEWDRLQLLSKISLRDYIKYA